MQSCLIVSKNCRTKQSNDEAVVLSLFFVIYVTNISHIIFYQTGHAVDSKIL